LYFVESIQRATQPHEILMTVTAELLAIGITGIYLKHNCN